MPESFRVLQKELQALGVDVKMYESDVEVNLQEAEKAERKELVSPNAE